MDADTRREFDSLKEQWEKTIAANDRRYEEKANAQSEALRVALQANEKRLDSMNGFRLALQDQTMRAITREEYETSKAAVLDKVEVQRLAVDARFEAEFKPLNDKLDSYSQPNWPLMASVMSIFLVMVAGIWLVIGLKIESTLSPVALALEQLKVTHNALEANFHTVEVQSASSLQSDIVSKSDRAALNERLRVIEQMVPQNAGERRAQYAVMLTKLTEIETQFCASDIVRNLIHAQDTRLIALMWHKINPTDNIPTNNSYYPKICNRDATSVP